MPNFKCKWCKQSGFDRIDIRKHLREVHKVKHNLSDKYEEVLEKEKEE